MTVDDLADILAKWRDQAVAVRVVTTTHDLVTVFRGRLRRESSGKGPAHFWPVDQGKEPEGGGIEQPGIYAHPALLEDARLHTGGSVLEFRQAGVVTNVRRLKVDRLESSAG